MSCDAIIGAIASILGGIIGGLFTYIGVKITINNDKKRADFENKKNVLPLLKLETEEYDYKNKYIQFEFLFTDESKQRKRKDIPDTANITFSINNVGMRELYDLYIADIQSTIFKTDCDCYSICPVIYSNDKISLNFYLYEMGIYDNDSKKEKYDLLISPITFNCYFKDCYENWYFQTVSLSLFHNIEKDTPIEHKALNVSIERFNILSSPKEVSEKDLPWKNEENKICIC